MDPVLRSSLLLSFLSARWALGLLLLFPWPRPFSSPLASCFCFVAQTLLYRWQLLLFVPKQQPDVVFLVLNIAGHMPWSVFMFYNNGLCVAGRGGMLGAQQSVTLVELGEHPLWVGR